ncbi:MAG: FkbM family methyltransferase [Magnetococcales bacterium]|nr:FkbM family methyltransferase [Magnetococcales bacterium]
MFGILLKLRRQATTWIKDRFPFLIRQASHHEPLFEVMLLAALQEPMTVLELGSSDGHETLAMLRTGGAGLRLHLLEPVPANRRRVQRRIRWQYPRDDRIRFHSLAVSDRDAEGAFYLSRDHDNLHSARPSEVATEKVPIQFVRLDTFCQREHITPPLLIKMDVEGHEVEILAGGMEFFTTHDNIRILLEVHPERYTPDHSLEKQLQKLFAAGFYPRLVESAGVPVPERFRELGLQPVQVAKNRGLYAGLTPGQVLEFACREIINPIGDTGTVTRKIVRSLLLEKPVPAGEKPSE